MSKYIIFHPVNQEMREIEENELDRAQEAGWRRVEKYDLLAVYSPTLNEHKTVLKADAQTWLNLGYYAEPTMVFHPDHEPRVVSAEEAKHLFQNGWVDSPAKFSKADKDAIVEAAVKEFKEAKKK